jgi:hypothetical protein
MTKAQFDHQTTIAPSAVRNVTPIESDVFDTIPAAAQPSPGLACAAAQIGALFSSNAIFLSPDGNIYRGQAEITRFYSNFPGRVGPAIVPLSFVGEGNECIMELAERRDPDGKFRLGAIDHFTVDGSGKIARMVVYLRPGVIEDLVSATKPNLSTH